MTSEVATLSPIGTLIFGILFSLVGFAVMIIMVFFPHKLREWTIKMNEPLMKSKSPILRFYGTFGYRSAKSATFILQMRFIGGLGGLLFTLLAL